MPMQARDPHRSRAHTQRVCARIPAFRALVPLAGALFDLSLSFYYSVAAAFELFTNFINGTREPSRARARRQAHACRRLYAHRSPEAPLAAPGPVAASLGPPLLLI